MPSPFISPGQSQMIGGGGGGHSVGVHSVPIPWNTPPESAQARAGISKQPPSGKQHAPTTPTCRSPAPSRGAGCTTAGSAFSTGPSPGPAAPSCDNPSSQPTASTTPAQLPYSDLRIMASSISRRSVACDSDSCIAATPITRPCWIHPLAGARGSDWNDLVRSTTNQNRDCEEAGGQGWCPTASGRH